MKNKSIVLLPSITHVLFLGLFFGLVLSAKSLLSDGDTGYHIRTGEFILQNHGVPQHDIFSFSASPIPWTAHEWLSEVIMAKVHGASGLTGISLFFALLLSLTYSFLFKIIRSQSNMLIAAVLILLAVLSSLNHWLARPHVFSMGLMMVWYKLLDDYQYKQRDRLYFLPLIVLLWVNLHGGFIVGFLLSAVYLFGNAVNIFLSNDKKKYREKTKRLALITVICLVVSGINPRGYEILFFPFHLILNKSVMNNIIEFLSPNFHEITPFRYLLYLILAVFAVSRSRIHLIELMLVLIFTHLALNSRRYGSLFAIITVPILARHAEIIFRQTKGKIIDALKKRIRRISAVDRSTSSFSYLWPAMGILAVFLLCLTGRIRYQFDETKMPVAAVEFAKKENIQGNMFNHDEFGDYMIYAAWPQFKVFMDGRSDMYSAISRLDEYLKVVTIRPGWDEIFKRHSIDWIIYNAGSALTVLLLERKDWRLVYADKVANIFVRVTAQNQPLIEKYRDVTPVSIP